MLKKDNNDSLELMLDTICNIFGGIILMAILVIIQTQITAGRMASQETDPDMEFARMQLQFECDMLVEEKQYKEEQKQSLLEQCKFDDVMDVESLLQQQSDLQSVITEAANRNLKFDEQIESLNEKTTTQEQQIIDYQKQLDSLIASVTRLQRDIEEQENTSVKNIRLPFRHTKSGIRFVDFLVKGKKIYWIDSIDVKSGTIISGHCHITARGSGTLVEPAPGRGYDIDETMSSAFDRILRPANAVGLFVYADNQSFESFQRIKNYVLEKGYLYRVISYDPKEGLILFYGSGAQVE